MTRPDAREPRPPDAGGPVHTDTDRALRHRRDSGGFTLIEVLVAMTVLALFAAVLLRGVVSLHGNAAWVDAHGQTEFVAKAVLDEALANRTLSPGTTRGERDGRNWSITASPLSLLDQLASARRGISTLAPPSDRGKAPSPAVPSSKVDKQLTWTPQRLIVRVEIQGRPVSIETIRLVMSHE